MKTVNSLFLCVLFVVTLGLYAAAQSGSLDSTFGNGGFVVTSVNFNTQAGWASDVAVQPDDKIVVLAESYNYGSTTARDFYVLRYNSDGSLDTTFGSGGVTRFAFTTTADNESPTSVALQPDGKILVGGYIHQLSIAAVARLNTDGSLDNSFGSGGKLTFQFVNRDASAVQAMAVQSDGKIILGGNSTGKKYGFARLNANGSFDTSFNGTGKLAVTHTLKSGGDGGMVDLTIQPDGKYLASGYNGGASKTPRSWTLMRVNTNGSMDTGFGSSGTATTVFSGTTWSNARHVFVLPDGKILAGGDLLISPYSSWVFIRYLSNGQLDTSFGSGGKLVMPSGGSSRVEGMAIQADGKFVGSGWWRDVNVGGMDVMMMRLNPDGTVDSGFGTGGFTFTDYNGMDDAGYSMAVQSDGKFVLAGIINGYSATTSSIGLYRYLP